VDSYKNMTLKQVSVLKYLSDRCGHLNYKYLLKTDDDVVLDLRAIGALSKRRSSQHDFRQILCFHMNEITKTPRDGGKWKVLESEYSDKMFPAYCSGAAYMITRDLVPVLFMASLHVKSLWIDDTYITGILPQAIGDVTLVQLPEQSLTSLELLRRRKYEIGKKMVFHVEHNFTLFDNIWSRILLRSGSGR